MPYLNSEQCRQFEQDGYVVVEGVLDPEKDIAPVIAEYEVVLDRLATELYRTGVIADTYTDLPFSDRLTRVYGESGRVHSQHFDFSLPPTPGAVAHDTPFWTGAAVLKLLCHDGILDAVESLIGPEIYSNPVQHVRLMPPERLVPRNTATGKAQLAATPWHQDNGVLTEEADETDLVTVWFPLVDATEEMGCLVVVPGSHREGLLTHCPGGVGFHVPDPLFEPGDGLALPMRCGSAIFMHRRTLHSSLPNRSDCIRASFDLRYQPVGQPTGRSAFPGFVARSRAHPDTEVRDPVQWTAMWTEARRTLAEGEPARFSRWDGSSAVCA